MLPLRRCASRLRCPLSAVLDLLSDRSNCSSAQSCQIRSTNGVAGGAGVHLADVTGVITPIRGAIGVTIHLDHLRGGRRWFTHVPARKPRRDIPASGRHTAARQKQSLTRFTPDGPSIYLPCALERPRIRPPALEHRTQRAHKITVCQGDQSTYRRLTGLLPRQVLCMLCLPP